MADGSLIQELDSIIEETNFRSVSRADSIAISGDSTRSSSRPMSHDSQLILKELVFLIDTLHGEFQGRIIEQDEPEFICLLVCLEVLLHHRLKESFNWFKKNEVWDYLKLHFQEREKYYGDNKVRSFILHSLYLKKLKADFKLIIANCRNNLFKLDLFIIGMQRFFIHKYRR